MSAEETLYKAVRTLTAEKKQLARDIVLLVDRGIQDARHGSVAWRDALLDIRERASKETGP